MQSAYTIQEYVAEVMRQLSGFVPNGQPVHFDVLTYNATYAYLVEELQEKGICVITDSGINSMCGENAARIEFDVTMKESLF